MWKLFVFANASVENIDRSIPAQNDLPSPRTRIARASPSTAARSVASPSSRNITSLTALRLSGRVRVIEQTPSSTS
jgi:hypothetical protein